MLINQEVKEYQSFYIIIVIYKWWSHIRPVLQNDRMLMVFAKVRKKVNGESVRRSWHVNAVVYRTLKRDFLCVCVHMLFWYKACVCLTQRSPSSYLGKSSSQGTSAARDCGCCDHPEYRIYRERLNGLRSDFSLREYKILICDKSLVLLNYVWVACH